MSGKYIVSESSSVIRAIETNLQHSQRVADTLKRATNQLTSALQSGDLKGRTYGSAKNYVLNVLNPLMNKASEGISDGLSDLATYKYEDGQIAHYGNIDVEQLKEEKQIKEEARRKVESQRERLQNLPLSALAVASPVAYAGALGAMVSFEQNMNDSIKKIDEKLLAYETFNSNTNGLFGDANALFENLENALNALSGIKISGSGSNLRLSIPSNVGGLVSKTTSSKLTAGDSDSSYGSIQSMAEELGISPEEAERLCKKYKVQPTDDIKTMTTTYVDPSSDVQHGITSVVNETTDQIISEKAWGVNGEIQNQIFKFGGPQIKKISEKYAIKNPDIQQLQKYQGNGKGIGMGIIEVAKVFDRSKEINKSLTVDETTCSGQEYIQSLIRAEEELKRKKIQQERDYQKLKENKNPGHNPNNHGMGGN